MLLGWVMCAMGNVMKCNGQKQWVMCAMGEYPSEASFGRQEQCQLEEQHPCGVASYLLARHEARVHLWTARLPSWITVTVSPELICTTGKELHLQTLPSGDPAKQRQDKSPHKLRGHEYLTQMKLDLKTPKKFSQTNPVLSRWQCHEHTPGERRFGSGGLWNGGHLEALPLVQLLHLQEAMACAFSCPPKKKHLVDQFTSIGQKKHQNKKQENKKMTSIP